MNISSIFYSFFLIFLSDHIFVIEGQFPTVCMQNATLSMAVCCPTPKGFSEACGGSSRGSCELIKVENQTSSVRWAKLAPPIRQDDRLHWPLRFFSFGCHCKGNYAGPACEKCKFGFTGPNCTTKRPIRVRRNIFNMTVKEQRLYRDIVNASKYTPTEYSIVSVAGPNTSDPITREKLYYTGASVYDFLVHFHYYSARSTMLGYDMYSCSINLHKLNYAHIGSAIWPWHRHYLLLFEEMMAEIAQKQFHQDNFALPYWDWINATDCLICNNDNVGDFYHPNITTSIPRTPEDVKRLRASTDTNISPSSPYSQWIPMCGTNTTLNDACFYCNLNKTKKSLLSRRLNHSPGFDVFPTQEEMDYVMSLNVYDLPPFNQNTGNASFRSSLEGFAPVGHHPRSLSTHNLAHSFFHGTPHDFSTSCNDPFFFPHHTFLDKFLEIWLNIKTEEQTRYPNQTDELGYGHDLDDYMVPSFPPVKVRSFYVKASEFGYTYDNDFIGTSLYYQMYEKNQTFPPSQQSQFIFSQSLHESEREDIVVLAVVASALVAGIILLSVYKLREMHLRKSRQKEKDIPKRWLFKMPFHSRQNTEEKVPLFIKDRRFS